MSTTVKSAKESAKVFQRELNRQGRIIMMGNDTFGGNVVFAVIYLYLIGIPFFIAYALPKFDEPALFTRNELMFCFFCLVAFFLFILVLERIATGRLKKKADAIYRTKFWRANTRNHISI